MIYRILLTGAVIGHSLLLEVYSHILDLASLPDLGACTTVILSTVCTMSIRMQLFVPQCSNSEARFIRQLRISILFIY